MNDETRWRGFVIRVHNRNPISLAGLDKIGNPPRNKYELFVGIFEKTECC
jgi:hypothetical protein